MMSLPQILRNASEYRILLSSMSRGKLQLNNDFDVNYAMSRAITSHTLVG